MSPQQTNVKDPQRREAFVSESLSTAGSPTFQIDADGVAWIIFDDPERPVNVLGQAVMRRFAETLDEARAAGREGRVKAVVIRSGKPGSFIAGADVDAIADLEDPAEAAAQIRLGQAIFMNVETLPVPTVAAIDGVCVGGGLEMALACDHRVVSDSPRTKLGLPEVMLGFLPAWGGTTRLPRLVGLQAALDLLLTGKQIDADKARRIGLAGEVLPHGLFEEKVRAFALMTPGLPRGSSHRKRKLLTRVLDGTAPGRAIVIAMARKKVMASTGGHYPAPLRILELLSAHLGGTVDASLAAEARIGAELVVSTISKNLVHVFHMREASRKTTGVADPSVRPRTIETMGVLGAGVMGGGIAQLAASRGTRVYMKDIRHEAVTGGLQHARELFEKAVKRRRLNRREADQHMELISGGLEYHGLSSADLVVEAVVERLDVKQAVLGEAEQHVRSDCVLASNTSSLSVNAMAKGLAHPERFCGMHFFNPVHRMPLVEVIRGEKTDDESLATVYGFALRLGKVPVVVGDGPGFLVNRILGPYLNEAGFLIGDGGSVAQVDSVAKKFGMPMGPLRLIDEIGIDVSAHAGASLHEALGDRLTPSPVLMALAKTGRLGKKGSTGFYLYNHGKETRVDETIYAELGSAIGGARVKLEARDIRMRLIIQMINEASRILEEGIVRSAQEVDLAMIMGTGFPPFRGGLLRFADTVHPRGILDRIRGLEATCGDRFAPSPTLLKLAADNRTFYEAFPK